MKQIIGIDPGASGAIAWRINQANVCKMPKDIRDIHKFLEERIEEERSTLIIIEKIQIRPGDLQKPERAMNLQKMKTQYDRLIATIILLNIPFIEVMPAHWQKIVGLQKVKNEEYTDRKKRLKVLAQKILPQKKLTLWNCDAYLLLYFGVHQLQYNPEYIWTRIDKQENLDKLF